MSLKVPQIRPSTRDAIIEAAFDLLSRDRNASLNEIAKRAGVGRATVHRQFNSRSDLVEHLTEIAIQKLDRAVADATAHATSYLDALNRILVALIPFGDRYGFLTHEPAKDAPETATGWRQKTRDLHLLIDQAKAERAIDPELPTFWVAAVFDHLLHAAWISIKNQDATHAQAGELAWRTFIAGVRKS